MSGASIYDLICKDFHFRHTVCKQEVDKIHGMFSLVLCKIILFHVNRFVRYELILHVYIILQCVISSTGTLGPQQKMSHKKTVLIKGKHLMARVRPLQCLQLYYLD
mmetsp:Transcript_147/g.183  ORF Transcript_147/g.183 Transcript_147/m.183 type:complete len:106 (-) Transcript_147:15-332(-)